MSVHSADDIDYTWPILFVLVLFFFVPYFLFAAVLSVEKWRGVGVNEPHPSKLARLFGQPASAAASNRGAGYSRLSSRPHVGRGGSVNSGDEGQSLLTGAVSYGTGGAAREMHTTTAAATTAATTTAAAIGGGGGGGEGIMRRGSDDTYYMGCSVGM